MAIDNYFSRYATYVSGLQNRIMQIQFKYERIQSTILADYEKGILSKDDFDVLYDTRMDVYIEGYNSKYVLSKEDTEYISEYADLDKNGKVLSTIVRYIYLQKGSRLESVFKAVKIFAYYDSLDYLAKREYFKGEVLKYYLGLQKNRQVNIDKLIRIYGNEENFPPRNKKLIAEMIQIQGAISAAYEILNWDDEKLMREIASFYNIKYQYYEWYKRMELKEEYDNGFVYGEHMDTMSSLSIDNNSFNGILENINSEALEAYEISKDLAQFLEEVSNFDIEDIEIESVSKKGIFRKNTKDDSSNKRYLYKIFCKLCRLYGVDFYLINNFDIEDDGKRLSNREIFDLYYNKYYGDSVMVEVSSFIRKFKDNVITYYKKILAQYDKVLKGRSNKLGEISSRISQGISRGVLQAKVINDIYNEYQGIESIILNGFTIEESKEIYESLKLYIINGFSFDEQVSKRKV